VDGLPRWKTCAGRSGLPRKPEREAVFHPEFRDDLRHWVDTDRSVALRILDLAEAVLRDPFTGIGKPEPLKYVLSGAWSRRITQEHRLVYRVSQSRIDFLQARYHY
jgi:toxin YoeB